MSKDFTSLGRLIKSLMERQEAPLTEEQYDYLQGALMGFYMSVGAIGLEEALKSLEEKYGESQ